MSFEPCRSCSRHVATSDPVCPFCGARASAVPRLAGYATRLTRAAVFAGAAACGSAVPKPSPPPPPVEYPFALPPAPAQDLASLSGVVRENGYRKAGVRVHARSESGEEKETYTNDKGEFQFLDLAPGAYIVGADPGYQNHRPQDGPVIQPTVHVQLAPNTNERHDLIVEPPPPYVPDTGPCCKPYGAPPARRRVV